MLTHNMEAYWDASASLTSIDGGSYFSDNSARTDVSPCGCMMETLGTKPIIIYKIKTILLTYCKSFRNLSSITAEFY